MLEVSLTNATSGVVRGTAVPSVSARHAVGTDAGHDASVRDASAAEDSKTSASREPAIDRFDASPLVALAGPGATSEQDGTSSLQDSLARLEQMAEQLTYTGGSVSPVTGLQMQQDLYALKQAVRANNPQMAHQVLARLQTYGRSSTHAQTSAGVHGARKSAGSDKQ